MISSSLVSYTLMAIARDRVFLGTLVATVIAVSLSIFFSSAAVIEKNAFVLTYISGSLRTIIAFSVIVAVTFFLRKAYDEREIEFFVATPLSRTSIILSFAVAFACLAAIMSFIAVLPLLIFIELMPQKAGFLLWWLSFCLEIILLSWIALFFATTIPSTAMSVVATTLFYVLARIIGAVLSIVQAGALKVPFYDFMTLIVKGVSIIIPRFDLVTQSEWLIYPVGHFDWLLLCLLQFTAFGVLIISATLFDFHRKEF